MYIESVLAILSILTWSFMPVSNLDRDRKKCTLSENFIEDSNSEVQKLNECKI